MILLCPSNYNRIKLFQTAPAFLIVCRRSAGWCTLLSAGRMMLSIPALLLPAPALLAVPIPSSTRTALCCRERHNIPLSEFTGIPVITGGFRKLNNLVKIQFLDKIDSIFVIDLKFWEFIVLPIYLYSFNLPSIAIISGTKIDFYFPSLFRGKSKMVTRTLTIWYFFVKWINWWWCFAVAFLGKEG